MNCTKSGLFLGGVAFSVSLMLLGGTCQAGLIPISNAQFDTSLYTSVARGASNIDLGGGWQLLSSSASTVTGGIDTINAAAYPSGLGSASGNKIFLNFTAAGSNANRQGYIRSPMLGDAAASTELLIGADKIYTLTIAAGNKTGNIFPGSNGENQSRNVFELLFDGTLKGARQFGFGGNNAQVLPPTGTDGTWQDFTISFTTDSAGVVTAYTGQSGTVFTGYTVPNLLGQNVLNQALRIRLRSDTYSKVGAQTIEFDNVRVDVTSTLIPEPGTLTMLCAGVLGLLGLVLARRNRKA